MKEICVLISIYVFGVLLTIAVWLGLTWAVLKMIKVMFFT